MLLAQQTGIFFNALSLRFGDGKTISLRKEKRCPSPTGAKKVQGSEPRHRKPAPSGDCGPRTEAGPAEVGAVSLLEQRGPASRSRERSPRRIGAETHGDPPSRASGPGGRRERPCQRGGRTLRA